MSKRMAALTVLLWVAVSASAWGDAVWEYRAAFGMQRVQRDRSLFAVAAERFAEAVPRLERELRERYPAARLEPAESPRGMERHGVRLIEVTGVDFAGMALALDLLRADPQVRFAESVYRIGGVVPLYPHPRIAVRFERDVPLDRIEEIVADLGGEVERAAPWNPRLLFVKPSGDAGTLELASRYDSLEEVLYGAPDFLVRRVPLYDPNDPMLGDQWHLCGGGAFAQDASVSFPEALDLAFSEFPLTPHASLVVGVCDSGVLVDHEDLRVEGGYDLTGSDVWINPDDNQDGHGTSVAGVAAAEADNGLGGSGGCPVCGVVGIKLDLPGVVSEADLGMAYYSAATEHDIPVLNNSWGLDASWLYVPMSAVMKDGIDAFSESTRGGLGGVIVFASGNSDQLAALDGTTGYNRTLTVGASTCQAHRASYSNYGHAVDVLAPSNGDGCGITTSSMQSTDSYTGSFGGTSSAAPLTSGIVGLITAVNPQLTEAQIRETIIRCAVPIDAAEADYGPSTVLPEDEDVVFSWTHAHGRVDAARAVEVAQAYGDSGCTEEYELCNGVDDDCDGSTDDESGACNPCQLDSESNGREFCDDGIDNDCDGLTDPDDCIVPCEDLVGMCNPCGSGADCWPGLDCSPISLDMENTYCLQKCLSDAQCPDGYWCETMFTHTCIPQGFSCEDMAEDIPDESCADDPDQDAGPEDAGPDGGDDTDTETGVQGDAGNGSPSSKGCGCRAAGADRAPAPLVALVRLLVFF